MIQIMLLSTGGLVQIDYKEEIVEGRGINEMFTTFLQKGDDGLAVTLRPGDNIVINKIPKEIIV